MGGLDKAKQVASLAHQGLMGTMMTSMMPDQGLGEVVREHGTYPGETLGTSRTMSVVTSGDDISVHMEYSEQKVNGPFNNQESGMNLGMDFTIQGAGSKDPVVRLDAWDALFGSCDQKRANEMGDLFQVRDLLGPGKFTLGPVMNGHPDLGAITDSIKRETTVELHKTEGAKGYRGLSDGFIRDFFRRPVSVDGVKYGGGGANLDQASRERRLDAFITAVGGENKAQTLSRVLFQNMAGIMESETLGDDDMQPVAMDFLMHQGTVLTDKADFSVTTRTDGKVDVHLECARHKGSPAPGAKESGRLSSLDFTVSGLGDGETPDIESLEFDILFTSNAARSE